MLLSLYLDSSKTSTTLTRNISSQLTSLNLVGSYLVTDSTTRKIYYVFIDNLYMNDITSNIISKSVIPVCQGSSRAIHLRPLTRIESNINYIIYDESGTPTTDAVSIDLLFEYN